MLKKEEMEKKKLMAKDVFGKIKVIHIAHRK